MIFCLHSLILPNDAVRKQSCKEIKAQVICFFLVSFLINSLVVLKRQLNFGSHTKICSKQVLKGFGSGIKIAANFAANSLQLNFGSHTKLRCKTNLAMLYGKTLLDVSRSAL